VLDKLVYKLGVPPAILSDPTAPQATRCVEILRWAEHAGRLADVARLLAGMTGTSEGTP
jgi:hypothetical protein